MFFNLQEDVAHANCSAQQYAGPEFRQREQNVGTNAAVECASSLSCHLPFSLQNRGEIEKPPFVNAHDISPVIIPNESPVCGSFQRGTVKGPVNWTWLGSPWSLIVSMTDWGLLGQNCVHTVTYNPIWGLNSHHNESNFEKKVFYFSFFSREHSKYIFDASENWRLN